MKRFDTMKNSRCLVCENSIKPFCDFGDMPIANAFTTVNQPIDTLRFEMKVAFCDRCKMVQLTEQPSREEMFHENYAFFSSTSNYMVSHFEQLSSISISQYGLGEESLVVEIGCNDGILLQHFANRGIKALGVEPSSNVADVARTRGLEVIPSFFDAEVAKSIVKTKGKVDAIFSANVICHIPYIHSIFAGVEELLAEDGVFIFEDPYLGDILQKSSFDQIYDEHVFFFSCLSVTNLAHQHNLEVIDVTPLKTHGGSMRYTLARRGVRQISDRVDALKKVEVSMGMDSPEAYEKFSKSVNKIRDDLRALLTALKQDNKKVVGYGATSKSTTLLMYCGIGTDLIDCIYDTTPIKQNKYTPGSRVPVRAYEEFEHSDPDYVLLFAWNHREEIMAKEDAFMKNGRKWITYFPQVEVIPG